MFLAGGYERKAAGQIMRIWILAIVALLSVTGLSAGGLCSAMQGDYATAEQDWLVAAGQGDAQAEFHLGMMHRAGHGVPVSDVEAAYWFQRAALRGHLSACFHLGLMFHEGRGLPQDDALAAGWLELAAEAGQAKAQYLVGTFYDLGRGVAQDRAAAIRWWRLSADQGERPPLLALGRAYAEGRGVPEDSVQALSWYRRAARLGSSTGLAKSVAVARKMPPKRVELARELSEDEPPVRKPARSIPAR